MHFIPFPQSDRNFTAELSFDVKNSLEPVNFCVAGSALCPKLRLEPDHVIFADLMLSELQAKEERKASFQIKNDSSFPVVVAAPDFESRSSFSTAFPAEDIKYPNANKTNFAELNDASFSMNEHGFCLLSIREDPKESLPHDLFSPENNQFPREGRSGKVCWYLSSFPDAKNTAARAMTTFRCALWSWAMQTASRLSLFS